MVEQVNEDLLFTHPSECFNFGINQGSKMETIVMKSLLARIYEIEEVKLGKPVDERYGYLGQQLRILLSLEEIDGFQKTILSKLQNRLHEEYWRSEKQETLTFLRVQNIIQKLLYS